MPIDYAGTTPGLPPVEPEKPKVVHMKCKAPNCPSIQVTEVTPPGYPVGAHMYACVACKTTWGIATGGNFNLG